MGAARGPLEQLIVRERVRTGGSGEDDGEARVVVAQALRPEHGGSGLVGGAEDGAAEDEWLHDRRAHLYVARRVLHVVAARLEDVEVDEEPAVLVHGIHDGEVKGGVRLVEADVDR